MSKSLKVIKSVTVTDAILTATDITENDHAAYNAATTYAVGDRVISGHVIYQSMQAGNVGKAPSTEPAWWVKVSPTNRWKAFDLSTTTRTAFTGSCYYEFETGVSVNAVGLLNFIGVNEIRIRLTDPSFGVVYDKTTITASVPSESSWYAWFFEERRQETQLIATDLPSYPNATLRIDIVGTGEIGALTFGTQKTIGIGVRSGVSLGMQDFSRKERNQWGDIELVQRAYAKRLSIDTIIENDQLDNTYDLLTSLRSTPCLWIASDRYRSLVVFGFFNTFDIVIPYPNHSECSIDLESLT